MIAQTEKISSGKCKPVSPATVDSLLLARKDHQDVVTSEVAMSAGKKKDRLIIALTQYGIVLNSVISDCIAELEAKDKYAARLREELK